MFVFIIYLNKVPGHNKTKLGWHKENLGNCHWMPLVSTRLVTVTVTWRKSVQKIQKDKIIR